MEAATKTTKVKKARAKVRKAMTLLAKKEKRARANTAYTEQDFIDGAKRAVRTCMREYAQAAHAIWDEADTIWREATTLAEFWQATHVYDDTDLAAFYNAKDVD